MSQDYRTTIMSGINTKSLSPLSPPQFREFFQHYDKFNGLGQLYGERVTILPKLRAQMLDGLACWTSQSVKYESICLYSFNS